MTWFISLKKHTCRYVSAPSAFYEVRNERKNLPRIHTTQAPTQHQLFWKELL